MKSSQWQHLLMSLSSILILICNSPAKGGLLLLITSILMIIQWNLSVSASFVGLIYISGLLILLLFLMSLMKNLKQTPSLNWLFLLLTGPVVWINLEFLDFFKMTILYKSSWISTTIFIFIILLFILLLITNIISLSNSIRSI